MLWSQMLPSFNDFLHVKKLGYQLTLYKDIIYQRILQSGWMRGTADHTQPKVVVSDDILA